MSVFDVEEWLKREGYDVSELTDNDWQRLWEFVEELEESVIEDNEDRIGEELVMRMELIKKGLADKK